MDTLKKIIGNPFVILVSRMLVGIIFIFFAIGKIANPGEFAESIQNYQIMPEATLNIFALFLPWVELVCGFLLISGIWLRASSLITAAMLVMFIGAVTIAMLKGLSIDCGCSTEAPQKAGIPKILENTGLTLLCLLIFLFPHNRFTIHSLSQTAKQ